MKLTGAKIIWECLVREGVEVVFGYPGGTILPAYDAMLDYPIHHVLVRHEQGGTHMADGYARASGRVGVMFATSGPGATNTVTGLATAMMDSSPVVCITGQVSGNLVGLDAFQETDVTGVTLPVTKHNYLVTRPEDIARTIREAFYIARTGRPGPVLVDITKDAQQKDTEFDWDAAVPSLPGYRPDLHALPEEYEKALNLIRSAKRPVILAGRGVLQAGAMRAVQEFAEKTNTPIAMTLLGIGGVPANHPLNLGMMGMHGEAWVNHAIQQADLLLAFGMRFDDRVTGNVKTYAPKAQEDSHRHRSVRDQQGRQGRCGAGRRSVRCAARTAAARAGRRSQRMAGAHRRDEGRFGGARYSGPARHRPSVCRARHQRSVALHQRRSVDLHRCGPAPDVDGAVLQTEPTVQLHHVGRPGHDGLWPARGDRRQVRAARCRTCGRSPATAASR